MSGLVLVALLAAEPSAAAPAPSAVAAASLAVAPASPPEKDQSPDAVSDGIRDTATQIVKALLVSDVEKLMVLTPQGFAFDGRQAWGQTDIRAEWTRALGRRRLTGAKIGDVEVVGYDDMVKRCGPPPDRWSKVNLSATRIAIVGLEGRPLLVIFRKRGDDWVPLGISD